MWRGGKLTYSKYIRDISDATRLDALSIATSPGGNYLQVHLGLKRARERNLSPLWPRRDSQSLRLAHL
jgi:hypothetical protein